MSKKTDRFVNRELSWLEFNQRVLDEARDPAVPVLERLKFLAITSSNLDEFFKVRVGGLHLLAKENSTKTDPSGMTAQQQLAAIAERTHRMMQEQAVCFHEELEPALEAAGIRRISATNLTDRQAVVVHSVFEEEVYSTLTPMAVTGPDDFPLLVHDTLNLFVRLQQGDDNQAKYAVIPFGAATSRFITLPSDGGYSYMLLEELVTMNIDRFFAGEEVLECVPFRINRNADVAAKDEFAADLLAEMEQLLRARTESDCVRLEIVAGTSDESLGFLRETLKLTDNDIYQMPGPLDFAAFMRSAGLSGFDDLRYEDWPPQATVDMDAGDDIFEVIRDSDILLHHPYESFDPVLRMIEAAADDPDVLAIKQTLYRTSRNSPIVAALTRAAEAGKSVTAIVELKARFDEARNIEWAKHLEQSGGQVIYGVMGLKTHAKVCIVIRREPQGIQRYVHFGTGNYNESTARLYTDISLLTCDEDLASDAIAFFNAITGYSQPQRYQKIEAAPIGLRDRLIELIQAETQRKNQDQPAAIEAKLNSLVDPLVIAALYEASQAGVPIRLNVRGICCLKPGVPGLSETIEVVSVIDRFLEHSRIMRFHHGGDDLMFISSADWMPRNLSRRIELLVPVDDDRCRQRLFEVLQAPFRDNVKARRILPDGGYEKPASPDDNTRYRSQEKLYEATCERVRQIQQTRNTVFTPLRAAVDRT